MDIKEALEREQMERRELQEKAEQYMSEAFKESRYQIPEDSDCIKDVDAMSDLVQEFIAKNIGYAQDQSIPIAERQSSLLMCREAVNVLNAFRHARLDVEFARRFKFNLTPESKPKE